jgi:hypothetical protein
MRLKSIFVFLLVGILLCLNWFGTMNALAEMTVTEIKVTASDGDYLGYFGDSVAIDGDTAIIGAMRDRSAYIFIKSDNNWYEEAKLTPSVGSYADRFGSSVDISGNTVIIGAECDNDPYFNSGSAYIFQREGKTWKEKAKLRPSDREINDNIGFTVSIDGNTAVVGSYENKAYVFVQSGSSWQEEAKLLPSDGGGYGFGYSVAISGDTIIVGSIYDDEKGPYSGAAHVFVRSGTTWTEQAKLMASDGEYDESFGNAVSIEGDTAIIGAYWDYYDYWVSKGSAYVFQRTGTTWTEESKLYASDGERSDRFGISVSISGNNAVIGAHGDDDNGQYSGSAYVFVKSGTSWTEEKKLKASDGSAWDYYGYSVGLSGGTALIGSPKDDDKGSLSGSAYFYEFTTSSEVKFNNMISGIENIDFSEGIKNSLISKMENAKSAYMKGNTNAVINMLNAFINQIEALRGKILTDELSNQYISEAEGIINDLMNE